MQNTVYETNIQGLSLIYRGKVRDMYQIDTDTLLIVATDRLSAFDVVLPDAIPQKGAILARISNFWFDRSQRIIKNHCSDIDLREVITDPDEYQRLKNHAVIVKKINNLPIEAIVRGYIIGSGFKEYQQKGSISGITLPSGLQLAEKLQQPIYTPSTKASIGNHDENISFEKTVELVGKDMAKQIQKTSLKIYEEGYLYAQKCGIIIADTKFEFGIDSAGDLVLIDEVLTPDSSRFWQKDSYQVGCSPTSFDKQYIRDYLETLDWDKKAPGPKLPKEVIQKTYEKYLEAQTRLKISQ